MNLELQSSKAKKLLKLIIKLTYLYKTSSKNVYSKLECFLSEPSHSFGFNVFDKLLEENVKMVDNIFGLETYSYYQWERFEEFNNKELFDLILEENKIKNKKLYKYEKQLLNIIIINLQQLYKENKKVGKEFSLFLTELHEDTALYGFKPIDDLIKFIEKELDLKIYPEVNNISENSKDYDLALGIFYWFSFSIDFGLLKNSKKKEIYFKDKTKKVVNNFNDFYEAILKLLYCNN